MILLNPNSDLALENCDQLLFHPEIEEKKFRGKYFIPFGVESTATLTDDAKDEKLAKKLWEFTDDLDNTLLPKFSWMNSAPKEILDKISRNELKRQEIIFETIYTEEDYINDLIILETVS
ncbi:8832_t:CDS:2 [Entrophospora sp. SA101]|nr:8832_t:CDS:2 [Entrophospora sp. SA101]